MAVGSLLAKVSRAVAACARGVSRATRRLLRARRSRQDGGHKRQQLEAPAAATDGDQQGGESLWRQAILMGERCEPLNFSGAIHYDSLGQPVAQPRGKAKAAAAAMLCRSSDAVGEAVTAAKYVAMPQRPKLVDACDPSYLRVQTMKN